MSVCTCLLILSLLSVANARIGFECETTAPVNSASVAGSSAPHLQKSDAIIRGRTLYPDQGPSWELQVDERWLEGTMQGFQLEMVAPPLHGYPTAADRNEDVVKFCQSIDAWTKELENFCEKMISKGTEAEGGEARELTMDDARRQRVVIETGIIHTRGHRGLDTKVKMDCSPQFTISLPPDRLWCFIKESFNPIYVLYFNKHSKGKGVDVRLAQIDLLAISPAAKLLLFFVGTLIRTGRSQLAPQAYLKTYAGTILTRSNLANVYEHGLTDNDKQFFSTGNNPDTSLAHQIVTIFAPQGYTGDRTHVPLFPRGWLSNTAPGEPIHLYLENLARGIDDLRVSYPKDVESLGAIPYRAGDEWVVEFRNLDNVIGSSMDSLRTAWIRLFEQAHHFQHAPMAGACPAFTFGHDGVFAKIEESSMSPVGTHWKKCLPKKRYRKRKFFEYFQLHKRNDDASGSTSFTYCS